MINVNTDHFLLGILGFSIDYGELQPKLCKTHRETPVQESIFN